MALLLIFILAFVVAVMLTRARDTKTLKEGAIKGLKLKYRNDNDGAELSDVHAKDMINLMPDKQLHEFYELYLTNHIANAAAQAEEEIKQAYERKAQEELKALESKPMLRQAQLKDKARREIIEENKRRKLIGEPPRSLSDEEVTLQAGNYVVIENTKRSLVKRDVTFVAILVLFFVGLAAAAQAAPKISEAEATTAYCQSIGGKEEVRHYYRGNSYVKVDCETATEVIEAGLDKRGSLDSLQQAIFFSVVTGKKPVVVIYDRDGKEGIYEYRIRKACEKVGVEFRRVKV